MNKIIFLKGIPASGKSAWAKKQVKILSALRVSKVDLRKMLGQQWSTEFEDTVKAMHYALVRRSLEMGQTVILDDTNFNPEHEQTFRTMAANFNVRFEVKEFNTPLKECLARNAEKEGRHKVPESVITKMWKRNYGKDDNV